MKKIIAVFALSSFVLGISAVNAQVLDKKVKQSSVVKPKQPFKPKSETHAAMETPESLCGTNTVLTSKIESCNVTETQECRRRVATCANANGEGSYTSSGVCTDCVPRANTKAPAEVLTTE